MNQELLAAIIAKYGEGGKSITISEREVLEMKPGTRVLWHHDPVRKEMVYQLAPPVVDINPVEIPGPLGKMVP